MSVVGKKLLRLADGREVWRITSVRYMDKVTGRFVPEDEVDDPKMDSEVIPELDLDLIYKRMMHILAEVSCDPEQVEKSITPLKMMLDQVERLKKEEAESRVKEDWFILGRELASEVLALLESEDCSS